MAGRIGGRFKARAALAAAGSKPPKCASAPSGAVDAAASAAAGTAKRSKSPHSWGSSSLVGMQRPGWGKKVTGDTGDPKTGGDAGIDTGTGVGGNCVVS